VEDQAPRYIGLLRQAVPGMELEPRDLPDGDQPLDRVDDEIGLAVAGYLDLIQMLRHAEHGMALEELFFRKAIRGADNGARDALDMWQHPITDLLVIVREIELGHRLAVAG